MSKRKDGQARGKYTLEFKLEAVRLVKGGQAVPVTAKVLGVPVQTLGNWVRLNERGQLKGAGDKQVSAEQMELARLRAELARVTMERDILKNRPRGLPRPIWIETRSAYTARAPDRGRLLFGGIRPRQKTWPRGSCGPSCGGTSCDPV